MSDTRFLNNLNVEERIKVLQHIDLLETYGNCLKMPFSKHLSNGIFELRIKQKDKIMRIFYFFCKNKVIILTHAIVKKSQTTPEKEIKLAEKYKTDYERRTK
jgi:phage-related protein